MLKDISDNYSDGSELNMINWFIKSRGGNLHPNKTTRGWNLEAKWKDESLSWIPLKDLDRLQASLMTKISV